MESRSSFWAFACQLYRHQQVEESCLWLQDQAGVDAVLLLCCCWAGREHGALDDRVMAALLDDGKTWSNALIKPLRNARRWLCEQPKIDPNLYEQLKNTELAAERQLMQRLEQRLQDCAGQKANDLQLVRHYSEKNTRRYFSLAGIDLNPDGELALARMFNYL
ncbi:MAG: TIGR02444 family protein [Porticoccaceae bacterium]|nr:TIGR02444 family protein [Porticoccaceae bacterium]